MKSDENVLINALKSGEEQAFRQLVEDYQHQVYNVLFRMVGDEDEAEDLAQEVFVEVYQRIASFRAESSLKTWVYRIAVNKGLDFMRKQKRQKRFAFIKSLFGVSEEIQVHSGIRNPDISMEQKEMASTLMIAVNRLPENQRIAFSLHRMEGLSYQEVADVMKATVSGVESLLFRAKKNLQQYLKSYYETL